MTPETYPGEPMSVVNKPGRYIRTGEFRKPLRGEFYLSGAIPAAYRAPNDLGTAYHICRPVEMETCACCNGTGQTVKREGYIMWLLIRTDQGGGYVARPGSASSYTRDIRNAQRFNSREEAERNACPGNERAVSYSAELSRLGY